MARTRIVSPAPACYTQRLWGGVRRCLFSPLGQNRVFPNDFPSPTPLSPVSNVFGVIATKVLALGLMAILATVVRVGVK